MNSKYATLISAIHSRQSAYAMSAALVANDKKTKNHIFRVNYWLNKIENQTICTCIELKIKVKKKRKNK